MTQAHQRVTDSLLDDNLHSESICRNSAVNLGSVLGPACQNSGTVNELQQPRREASILLTRWFKNNNRTQRCRLL